MFRKSDMFRNFKRHYHTTKRAYFEAAKDSSNLGFSISHTRGEPAKYSENSPHRDKTAIFAALVYKFLDERSDLYYRKVLDLIKSDFPNVITAEDFEAMKSMTGNF